MLTYLTIFGLVLLLISFFLKGVLIQMALFCIWIGVIVTSGNDIPAGEARTWLQIAAGCLLILSVAMMVKKFFSTSGVD
jgi:hypothetical protein